MRYIALLFTLLLFTSSLNYADVLNDKPDITKIQLGSVHAAVFDMDNDVTLYSKHSDTLVPIASITKLMAAMVVLDSKRPLNEYVTIHKANKKSIKNAYSRIRINSKLKRGDLIKLALMSSENLSATVLALDYPGGVDAFVTAMNNKAKSLDMLNTRFVDSSGLSPENVSTAADLVKMVSAAAKYEKIREYSTTARYTANFKNPRYKLTYGNTNPLVHRRSWDVLLTKTGYLTEAGRCLVMLTEIENRQIAIVLLDSFGKRTPLGDAGRVKRWLTTGNSGAIAGAALKYEREKTSKL